MTKYKRIQKKIDLSLIYIYVLPLCLYRDWVKRLLKDLLFQIKFLM